MRNMRQYAALLVPLLFITVMILIGAEIDEFAPIEKKLLSRGIGYARDLVCYIVGC